MSDARFALLDRAWRPVLAWNTTADPRCPCKGIVWPLLKDWQAFRSDWLAGAPDEAGLEEQTSALRDAIAIIQQYAGRKLVLDMPDGASDASSAVAQAAKACPAGDPRCASVLRDLTDPSVRYESAFLAARAGRPESMLQLMAEQESAAGDGKDPTMGAVTRKRSALASATSPTDPRLGAVASPASTAIPIDPIQAAQAQAASIVAPVVAAATQAATQAAQPSIDAAACKAADKATAATKRNLVVATGAAVILVAGVAMMVNRRSRMVNRRSRRR